MIRKILRYITILVVAALVVIQFINRPETHFEEVTQDDIILNLNVDTEIAGILKSACYDCHSDQPRYPWYASIAPVSWWIEEHMEHGRDELNFSKWATFSKRKRDHKLEEMVEEVEEGHMPLPSYTRMHSDARLTDEQIAKIEAWVESERAKIAEEED